MTIIYIDPASAALNSISSGSFDTDNIPSTYTYNADGTLATESISHGGATWVRTYAYTTVNGVQKPSGKPAWVKQ